MQIVRGSHTSVRHSSISIVSTLFRRHVAIENNIPLQPVFEFPSYPGGQSLHVYDPFKLVQVVCGSHPPFGCARHSSMSKININNSSENS